MISWKKQLSHLSLHPFLLFGSGFIACSLALVFLFYSYQKLSLLEEKALYLHQKKQWMQKRQAKEQKLLNQMISSDQSYVEKQLQTLEFLRPEVEKLRTLNPDNQTYKNRLKMLTGLENRLSFKEQNFQHLDRYREVELIQKYPVEMNEDDLLNVLERIESDKKNLNPPHLLIKKCELQKKRSPTNDEIFLVQLEILKKEIAHD